MSKKTKLGIFYDWALGSNYKVGMDSNLRRISALLHGYVISNQYSDPPSAASDGEIYIVGTPATNDWAGYENYIAVYNGFSSSWEFIAPEFGMILYVQDNETGIAGDYVYKDSTGWERKDQSDKIYKVTNAAFTYGNLTANQAIDGTFKMHWYGVPDLDTTGGDAILDSGGDFLTLTTGKWEITAHCWFTHGVANRVAPMIRFSDGTTAFGPTSQAYISGLVDVFDGACHVHDIIDITESSRDIQVWIGNNSSVAGVSFSAATGRSYLTAKRLA